MHFLGLAGIPRRYRDYPDFYRTWNVIARAGSMISVVSSIFLILIIWEALIVKRPAFYGKLRDCSLETIHTFPPISHRYNSTPLVYS
jgi:heme/copper-type cytochrome/quinol oxidase subunit 1